MQPHDTDISESEAVVGGGCACGAVRYRVTGPLRDVVNCHCEPCRRTTGHHMAATAADPDAVLLMSTVSLKWYSRTDTVQYGFCVECGSSLFWRAADKPTSISITAGSLDHPTGLTTSAALFTAEHGDYFESCSFPIEHLREWPP